jgi:hypothetical protein
VVVDPLLSSLAPEVTILQHFFVVVRQADINLLASSRDICIQNIIDLPHVCHVLLRKDSFLDRQHVVLIITGYQYVVIIHKYQMHFFLTCMYLTQSARSVVL